jgi:hypothetical protein
MGSEHPLARAVVEYASTKMQLPLSHPADFQARIGKGVTCTVDHREVCIGTRELMAEVGAVVRAEDDARIRTLEALGKTVLLVSLAPHASLSGMVAVADTLKEEASSVVAALMRKGIEVWMLTGDNERTANAIAAQVTSLLRLHALHLALSVALHAFFLSPRSHPAVTQLSQEPACVELVSPMAGGHHQYHVRSEARGQGEQGSGAAAQRACGGYGGRWDQRLSRHRTGALPRSFAFLSGVTCLTPST